MKGIKLFFSVCLVLLSFCVAKAEETSDTARAATRRSSTTTVTSSNRQKSAQAQNNYTNNTATVSRTTNNVLKSQPQVSERSISSRSGSVVTDNGSRNANVTSDQSVSARTTSNVQTRTITSTANDASIRNNKSSARSAQSISRATQNSLTQQPSTYRDTKTISRSSIIPTGVGNINTKSQSQTSASRRNTVTGSNRLSRSAITAEEIMNRDYTKCREVYYECMDEFCANKDSQLRRCACSSRTKEFDSIKKQLNEAEDKLLNFNQRLLTVNMDKEDAEALFEATEGELAFQQEDKTDSKKMLDEITEKLNTTFSDNNFNTNLSPISLSLNVDAAFDNIDSLMGSSTTTKSGTELYSAALPICREIALEICSQDELDIVESGYQMAIEQDCNTVAKTYESQQDQTLEKIREGSALLDMSRLDIYQERNSDDILTCKKKMLDMLTDSTVCGDNLGKCLDITGQYIDPSTGEAILTTNLANLNNLISRPEGDQKWTNVPGNEKFVSYLNSKKKYLEPAMENCQDISDYVWDTFIEDALAQIKLAQESKLEDIRQSCTTLTTQCLNDSADSLEDFDARSLSIFGVIADKTVKEMCSEVQNACTALLEETTGGTEWTEGITEIATSKTYETILQTCREVGRSCIIQACKSVSGNFALCEDIQLSVNRKSIINRTSCWDEVVNCVKEAGTESINNIITNLTDKGTLNPNSNDLYSTLYGKEIQLTNNSSACLTTDDANCLYDICAQECGLDTDASYTKTNSIDCKICRLAERVWGNCESHPATIMGKTITHNQIKMPISSGTTETDTLLSWFAKNTGTENEADSCRDTSCGPGQVAQYDKDQGTTICLPANMFTDDDVYCPIGYAQIEIFKDPKTTNCCKLYDGTDDIQGKTDTLGHCCFLSNLSNHKLYWGSDTSEDYYVDPTSTTEVGNTNVNLCLPENAKFVVATNNQYIFCVGEIKTNEADQNVSADFPNGKTIECNGQYIIVNKSNKIYEIPNYNEGATKPEFPKNYYNIGENTICEYDEQNKSWTGPGCREWDLTNWLIRYK